MFSGIHLNQPVCLSVCPSVYPFAYKILVHVILCRERLQFSFDSFNPFPNDKFQTPPNWKSLQTTISNLMKTVESTPNG